MRIFTLFVLVLSMIFAAGPCPARDSGTELLKVVVLSRHGLRAPTQDAKLLELWSQKTWPVWPVERGFLTPRGYQLVDLMWSNLRNSLKGLLEKKNNAIYVRADVDERTKATAQAILSGLSSDDGFHVAKTKVDPLFHPVRAGLYRYDAIAVATDVLAMTHGGLERLQDEFAGAVNLLSTIGGTASPALCSRFALMPKCQISDLPNAISVSPDGTAIRLVGSLGISSSMAEIFLLEYGEWPHELAGWGAVDARVLAQVLPIHSRVFDVVNRAPIIAWANGSALLSEMAAALFGTHPDPAINGAKLVIFVGHDTNIANVAALLNLDWQATGYPPNGIPPAGALFLELWRENGKQVIIPRFHAQTPATLHTPVTGNDHDAFAPRGVGVYTHEKQAIFDADAFRKMVQEAVAGAPTPGHQELELVKTKDAER